MMFHLTILVALFSSSVTGFVVDTIYGRVDGNTVTLDDGTVIYSYYGIPFAKPPVGDLRFEQPQAPDPWSGTLSATELPNVCIQDPVGAMWMTHPLWTKYSEDCLNLNIYAPADTSGAPYPVMVWFHGGAYVSGGNVQYPGHFLAAKGVIVVTANYRLAAFGFVATPDKTIRGNMGLFDQALALRFVRNNIANFGGDPNKVTIFGQSAGAGSVSLQQISPYSAGLFHQAIQESGTEQNVWTLNYPEQSPEQYVYQLAEKTNCTRDTDPEMVACLKTVDARDIRLSQGVVCTPGYFCQGYAPIVDGPGGFVPDLPKTLKENLGAQTLPVISGICKDDGSLYTPVFIPEANDGGFNSTMFNYYLKARLIDIFAEQLTQEQYDNVYEALHYNYAPWPYLDDLEGNRQAFNKLITDAAFGYPWDRSLKTNSEFNPNTYGYVAAFRSLNASSFIPEWMGVPHMGELPYVWGYANLLNNPAVRDDSGIHFDIIGWTPEDITYADYQMTLWTNFAKYANPTPTPVKAPFDDTLTTWEKFSWDDQLKVLWLDTQISTKSPYNQQNFAFWREYIAYLAGRPVKEGSASSAGGFSFSSETLHEAFRTFVADTMTQHGYDVHEFADSLDV